MTIKIHDISTELYRVYTFDTGYQLTIDKPITLSFSKRGSRILDEAGMGHYIPDGWVHLTWKTKPDCNKMLPVYRER